MTCRHDLIANANGLAAAERDTLNKRVALVYPQVMTYPINIKVKMPIAQGEGERGAVADMGGACDRAVAVVGMQGQRTAVAPKAGAIVQKGRDGNAAGMK